MSSKNQGVSLDTILKRKILLNEVQMDEKKYYAVGVDSKLESNKDKIKIWIEDKGEIVDELFLYDNPNKDDESKNIKRTRWVIYIPKEKKYSEATVLKHNQPVKSMEIILGVELSMKNGLKKF